MAIWLHACGGSSANSQARYGGANESADSGGYASGGYAPGVATASASEESSYDFSDDAVQGELVRPDGEMYGPSAAPAPAPMSAPGGRPMYAQATPQTPSPQGPQATQPSPMATDASPGGGPLLIYEAQLYLAVYKVEENLKAVAKVGTDIGGFLSRQDDRSIVIRVPAGKFHEAVAAIEALGDVLHRQVQATDVSEEFRDVEIRIRNSMQVRDRLAELLTRATKVEESLQIERELERLTGEIERLKGRMRFLQDRIAYSTITVSFQPKEQERIDNSAFRLPFPWLDSLGLQRLLSL